MSSIVLDRSKVVNYKIGYENAKHGIQRTFLGQDVETFAGHH